MVVLESLDFYVHQQDQRVRLSFFRITFIIETNFQMATRIYEALARLPP